jgi:hypothetical protein
MKTGRNDPCPCGSGKKYKRCCMEADLHPARASHPSPVSPPDPRRPGVTLSTFLCAAEVVAPGASTMLFKGPSESDRQRYRRLLRPEEE